MLGSSLHHKLGSCWLRSIINFTPGLHRGLDARYSWAIKNLERISCDIHSGGRSDSGPLLEGLCMRPVNISPCYFCITSLVGRWLSRPLPALPDATCCSWPICHSLHAFVLFLPSFSQAGPRSPFLWIRYCENKAIAIGLDSCSSITPLLYNRIISPILQYTL